MDLQKIKDLIKQKKYQEAITECALLLANTDRNSIDILRTRAYAFALSGNIDSAVKDRQAILGLDAADLRDYFLAANDALFAGKLQSAASLFQEVLRIGSVRNEPWFQGGAYFLLAFTHLQLRNYEDALENLNMATAVEADIGMPVPGACGIYTHRQLREEILREANTLK